MKKLTSNEDSSREPVEAGLGIWKDPSKSSHVDVAFGSGFDTAQLRPVSVPLGRFGRGPSLSLSDKRRFLDRRGEFPAREEGTPLACKAGDGKARTLKCINEA